jgi:hypothetical protein
MASRYEIFVAGDGENSIRVKSDAEYIRELEFENALYRGSLEAVRDVCSEYGMKSVPVTINNILARKMPSVGDK